METQAEVALRVIQQLREAVEARDWATFGAQFHDDAVYELVGRTIVHGRDNIVDNARSTHIESMRVTQDLWTADETARVWWRYAAEWADPETAEQRQTSGASTALVRDGAVESLTSWIDLSFLLLKT